MKADANHSFWAACVWCLRGTIQACGVMILCALVAWGSWQMFRDRAFDAVTAALVPQDVAMAFEAAILTDETGKIDDKKRPGEVLVQSVAMALPELDEATTFRISAALYALRNVYLVTLTGALFGIIVLLKALRLAPPHDKETH